jgi:hypothetical protein
MTTEELKIRLDQILFDDISIGYSEICFVRSSNFDRNQIGYRIDPNGISLIGAEGYWLKEWYVIAWDDLGDPIFINLDNNRVYTAIHGAGSWDPICIADSFDDYENIIQELNHIAFKRDNPVALKNNPISISIKEKFLNLIAKHNLNSDHLYWKLKIGGGDEL